jgi:drug/metabolite transporter (DMT)-like permease
VTFLWASSWVLIKVGLQEEDLEPLGFAGLRYGLAALVLLPLAIPVLRRARPWQADRRVVGGAITYGFVLFGVAQASQYVALDLLPAATVGLFMAMAPVGALLLTLWGRQEPPSAQQVIGVAVLAVGVVVFFAPQPPPEEALLGVVIAVGMMVAVAWSAMLGRAQAVAAAAFGGIIGLTAVAMVAGAITTLATAILIEGAPVVSPRAWLIVTWLAIVHTALGFGIWNHGLRTLSALEASALADLTVIQIALLAWVFLGESLDGLQVAGLAITLLGVIIVQVAPAMGRKASPGQEASRGPGDEAAPRVPPG